MLARAEERRLREAQPAGQRHERGRLGLQLRRRARRLCARAPARSGPATADASARRRCACAPCMRERHPQRSMRLGHDHGSCCAQGCAAVACAPQLRWAAGGPRARNKRVELPHAQQRDAAGREQDALRAAHQRLHARQRLRRERGRQRQHLRGREGSLGSGASSQRLRVQAAPARAQPACLTRGSDTCAAACLPAIRRVQGPRLRMCCSGRAVGAPAVGCRCSCWGGVHGAPCQVATSRRR